MKQAPRERAQARGLRVAVLRSLFNRPVTDGLVEGALEALRELGAKPGDVRVVDVPGAFELPLVAQAAARSRRFDAVIALGAVIRGETDHYDHVAREAAAGIAAVSRETGVPVAFGVLTVREEEQATRRSLPGPENKGAEAARAVVLTVQALREVGAPLAGRTAARRRG
jgi:6,7-dimethyl-8-ribityllumazine synthase